MAVDVRHQQSAGSNESAISESERLFAQYSERILAFCSYTLRDRSEAEDAVQTTFLQAHRALQRGVTLEFEYAWLHTIAKNVCRTQLRTGSRRHAVTGVELDEIPAEDGLDEDEQELRRGIGDALASLPDRQRRALVMRELQGLSSEEVASQLGMSAPATYALLTRARQSLARALAPVAGVPALGLDFRSLLLKLKVLLGGGSAKVAATTAIVAAVVVGGTAVGHVVVERDAPDRAAPGASGEVDGMLPASVSRTGSFSDSGGRPLRDSVQERQPVARTGTPGASSPTAGTPNTTETPVAVPPGVSAPGSTAEESPDAAPDVPVSDVVASVTDDVTDALPVEVQGVDVPPLPGVPPVPDADALVGDAVEPVAEVVPETPPVQVPAPPPLPTPPLP